MTHPKTALEKARDALAELACKIIEDFAREVIRIGDLPVMNEIRLELAGRAKNIISRSVPDIRKSITAATQTAERGELADALNDTVTIPVLSSTRSGKAVMVDARNYEVLVQAARRTQKQGVSTPSSAALKTVYEAVNNIVREMEVWAEEGSPQEPEALNALRAAKEAAALLKPFVTEA